MLLRRLIREAGKLAAGRRCTLDGRGSMLVEPRQAAERLLGMFEADKLAAGRRFTLDGRAGMRVAPRQAAGRLLSTFAAAGTTSGFSGLGTTSTAMGESKRKLPLMLASNVRMWVDGLKDVAPRGFVALR